MRRRHISRLLCDPRSTLLCRQLERHNFRIAAAAAVTCEASCCGCRCELQSELLHGLSERRTLWLRSKNGHSLICAATTSSLSMRFCPEACPTPAKTGSMTTPITKSISPDVLAIVDPTCQWPIAGFAERDLHCTASSSCASRPPHRPAKDCNRRPRL